MDPVDFGKLNIGLIMAVRAYQQVREAEEPDASISIKLRFQGDLAEIEALGFETHSVSGDQALGEIKFRDIPKVAKHPGVISLSAGGEWQIALDTAVADGRVRASSAANIGGATPDGLWHADPATGTFTPAADATGKDVIVAIIDTGIDFTHPAFMSQLTPTKKTHIKRIWDQGLKPGSLAECPDFNLFESKKTYGVEFKDAQIEAALNGGAPIAHKDCNGHGTHVAAIAAGGTLFPGGGDAKIVGVAPEADIIAVKVLDVPQRPDGAPDIKFRLAAGFGGDVSQVTQIHDAIMYCLKTAHAMGKPVVINMSMGNSAEPGDGLDDDAVWIDGMVDPAKPAGPKNFPKRAIIVKASGNDGALARRQVAHIKVPDTGEITIPFELKDERVGVNTKFKNCADAIHKLPVRVDIWYRRNFDLVKFALKLPRKTTFGADMGVAGWEDHAFILRSGPPPSLVLVGAAPNVHQVFAKHNAEGEVMHPSGSPLRRHSFLLVVAPKVSGATVSYAEGIYEVRIKAPKDTELFAMCAVRPFAPKKFVTFRIASTMADGVTALHPNIGVTSEFSATDTLGQHVITVASYNDTDGVAANAEHHKIAASSSRGPLRDFSNPTGSLPLIATKPDIAAPGVKIKSAESANTQSRPLAPTAAWLDGVRFIEMSGTSMAAPFITGVVALMLDKDPDLNVTQVRTALTTGAAGRPGKDPAPPGDAHKNAYGSGMVDGLKSHQSTP